MKKFSFIFLSVLLISGCSNSCDSAKANVAKYLNQYLNAIYQGQSGASVPGGAEALQALEVAKKACNRPDLTIEEMLNSEMAKIKAQVQQPIARAQLTDSQAQQMIKKYSDSNERCRDTPGGDDAACNQRNQLLQELKENGWCLGHGDEAAYQYKWHKCDANSN